MKSSKTLVWLSGLVVLLALYATFVGLTSHGETAQDAFTSIRGETVQLYGQGLYGYDSRLVGTGYKVQDAVTLVLGIPLLVAAAMLYRRGSSKAALFLPGVLAYFLYNYGSLAFGAAYNNLFLVYVVLLSASFFGLVLALTSVDVQALPGQFGAGLPRRGISTLLIVSGILLPAVWLFMSILPAMLAGRVPELGGYTTGVTWAVDMGIVGPALVVAGLLLYRWTPAGYLFASTMLVFSAVLGVQLAAMGVVQYSAGLFGIGQFIGMVVSFAVLTLFAIWFTIVFFRHMADSTAEVAAK